MMGFDHVLPEYDQNIPTNLLILVHILRALGTRICTEKRQKEKKDKNGTAKKKSVYDE